MGKRFFYGRRSPGRNPGKSLGRRGGRERASKAESGAA
jgi:hypothetical protein